jgi:hypothetical protein
VADLSQTLRDCGVLPPDVPAPRTRDELKELIVRRCTVTQADAAGDLSAVALAGTTPELTGSRSDG